jgi:hypothetical protein
VFRSRGALVLALMLGTVPTAAETPSEEQVKAARKQLKFDPREGAEEALDILSRDGSSQSLKDIALYGARTARNRNAIAAGKVLAAKGDQVALRSLGQAVRNNKKNPANLARIAMMTEQVPGNRARDMLVGFARDKRDVVATTAIRALGARHEEGARSALHSLLKSPRSAVSGAAAFALSRLAPQPATMELLFKRVQKAIKARVGDSCALALSRMEGAEPFGNRALALAITRSTHDSFHALAKLALRLAKEPDPELLSRALKSPSPPVREVACDLIGLNKVKGFQRQILKMAAEEHNWRNRVAAWLALRRAGCDEVLDGIRTHIMGRAEPSYWAIQCISKNPQPKVMDALRRAALDTKDPVRRELAQRALRNAPDTFDESRSFYLQTWKKQRGTKRGLAALLGLGNLRDAPSFLALVDLLEKETEKKYRLWILKGLEILTGHYYEPNHETWREWYKFVEGKVAFTPPKIDRKKNRERIKKIQEIGISRDTEEAVENGLRWLQRHQDLDGGWNGATYHKNCTFIENCAKEGGIRERSLAYTGLALLAFQGAGYTHLDGPYRDVMQRGWEYLQTHQDYDGSHHEKGWMFSYEGAIVCQALCDGYGLTGDKWLGEGAQRMIDYFVKIQYPGRTWRYRVRSSETDTSVMSWIVTACISARHAGLDMPEQIFVASEAWLNRAADPVPPNEYEVFVPDQFKKKNRYFIDVSRDRRGKVRTFKIKTWYQPPRLYTPAMSAIGVLMRIWFGWTRAHPFCIGGANQVISQIPGYGTGLEGEFAFYPYTWYYGSLAMYQMGGRYWSRWREKCIRDVIKHQHRAGCKHGSWEMPRGQLVAGLTGGSVYCTAMAILTLESFYRYQPYLARFELRSREEWRPEAEKPKPEGDGPPPAGPGGEKKK